MVREIGQDADRLSPAPPTTLPSGDLFEETGCDRAAWVARSEADRSKDLSLRLLNHLRRRYEPASRSEDVPAGSCAGGAVGVTSATRSARTTRRLSYCLVAELNVPPQVISVTVSFGVGPTMSFTGAVAASNCCLKLTAYLYSVPSARCTPDQVARLEILQVPEDGRPDADVVDVSRKHHVAPESGARAEVVPGDVIRVVGRLHHALFVHALLDDRRFDLRLIDENACDRRFGSRRELARWRRRRAGVGVLNWPKPTTVSKAAVAVVAADIARGDERHQHDRRADQQRADGDEHERQPVLVHPFTTSTLSHQNALAYPMLHPHAADDEPVAVVPGAEAADAGDQRDAVLPGL